MKLFIGNIAYATSEESLRSFFEEFGPLRSVKIATDRDTGRSRGFGFIEIDDDAQANAAIEARNGQSLDGKALNVSEARPREDRPRSGGFGGGGGGGGRRPSGGGDRGGYSGGGGRY
jgi:RNA recognition motif-containing protein